MAPESWAARFEMIQIYIMRNGERRGPYSLEEVNRQLAAGILEPVNQAWSEGWPGWKPLLSFPGVIMPGGASSTAMPLGTATVAHAERASYAGFWIRVIAYLIDCVILAIPVGLLFGMSMQPSDDPDIAYVLFADILLFVINLLYFAGFWASPLQATPGQKICRIKVVEAMTRTKISLPRGIGRWFALLLAMMLFFVGVLMVAWTERKRGLHDILAGTCVLKER